MSKIKVLKIEPGKHPVNSELETSIEAFNRAVSIGACEIGKVCSKKIDSGIYILYNSNGDYYELTANRKVDKEIILGVFYVIGVDASYYPRSLTQSEVEKYTSRFWEPEAYSYIDIVDNSIDMLYDSLKEIEKM